MGLLQPLLITYCVSLWLCTICLSKSPSSRLPYVDHLSALKESIELHSISFPKDYLRVNHHKGLGLEVLENPWQQGARSAFFGFFYSPHCTCLECFLSPSWRAIFCITPLFSGIGRIYANQFLSSNTMV